jgi:hypothetical protein
MLLQHRRLAIAGAITATALAVPTAALASGFDLPSGKPASSPASAAAVNKPAAAASKSPTAGGKSAAGSDLAALAASAGISTDRLQIGLAAAKQAGDTPAGIAVFAASTGASRATAQRIVHAVFGMRVSSSGTVPSLKALATRLGVGASAAARAVKQIAALSRNGGVDPTTSAFAAIAHDLGVSPAELAAAWNAVKPSMAGG